MPTFKVLKAFLVAFGFSHKYWREFVLERWCVLEQIWYSLFHLFRRFKIILPLKYHNYFKYCDTSTCISCLKQYRLAILFILIDYVSIFRVITAAIIDESINVLSILFQQ